MSADAGDFLLAVVGPYTLLDLVGMFYGIAALNLSGVRRGLRSRRAWGLPGIDRGIALGVITLQPWYDIGDGFHSLYHGCSASVGAADGSRTTRKHVRFVTT